MSLMKPPSPEASEATQSQDTQPDQHERRWFGNSGEASGHGVHSPVDQVAVADVDADGLWDVYLVSGKKDQLWKNLGILRFKNVTNESGLTCESRVGSRCRPGRLAG
jgi:hypothetical protein